MSFLKNIENLSKMIPLVGSILIVAGVINQIIFYSFFGIDIILYLEFSEIITLFLNDLIIILLPLGAISVSFVGMKLYGSLVSPGIKIQDEGALSEKLEKLYSSILKSQKDSEKYFKILLLLCVTLTSIYVGFLVYDYFNFYSSPSNIYHRKIISGIFHLLGSSWMTIVILIFFRLSRRTHKKIEKKGEKAKSLPLLKEALELSIKDINRVQKGIVVLISGFAIILFLYLPINKALGIKYGYSIPNLTVRVDPETIESSPEFIGWANGKPIIGLTRKYFIVYQPKRERTVIYPIEGALEFMYSRDSIIHP